MLSLRSWGNQLQKLNSWISSNAFESHFTNHIRYQRRGYAKEYFALTWKESSHIVEPGLNCGPPNWDE